LAPLINTARRFWSTFDFVLLFQDPVVEEKQLIGTADQQHEEILANFDSFLKLAGSELLSVKDMAKNMTGTYILYTVSKRKKDS
jgi:hypothetical protein